MSVFINRVVQDGKDCSKAFIDSKGGMTLFCRVCGHIGTPTEEPIGPEETKIKPMTEEECENYLYYYQSGLNTKESIQTMIDSANLYYICPKCGHKYFIPAIRPDGRASRFKIWTCDFVSNDLIKRNGEICHLACGRYNESDYAVTVFDNGDQIKITAMVRMFIMKYDKLTRIYSKSWLCINLKTGRSTYFNPSSKIGKRGKMHNSTYGVNKFIGFNALEEGDVYKIIKLMSDKLKERGYYADSLKKLLTQKPDTLGIHKFNNIVRANKFPEIPPAFFTEHRFLYVLVKGKRKEYLCMSLTKFMSQFDRNVTFDRVLDVMMIPRTKTVRNAIKNNPILAFSFNKLPAMGITKTDSYNKILVNSGSTVAYAFRVTCDDGSVLNDPHFHFIKALVKDNGENVAVNKLCDNRMMTWTFSDTARTFKKMQDHYPEELKKVNLKANLKVIHDEIHLMYDKLGKPNVQIPFTKKEEELECELGFYQFVLPKDTHSLIDIGSKMHICVGGYDEYAVSKKSLIVVMMKDGRYVTCIEMRGANKKEVVQTKLSYNNRPTGEILEVLKKYFKQHDVKITTGDMSGSDRMPTGYEYDEYGLRRRIEELPIEEPDRPQVFQAVAR